MTTQNQNNTPTKLKTNKPKTNDEQNTLIRTKKKKTQKLNKNQIHVMCRGQPVALSWRRLNTIAPLPNVVDAWNHTHNNNFSNSNDIHNHL